MSTYIQSGNVLLASSRPQAQLEGELEATLEARFGVPLSRIVGTTEYRLMTIRNWATTTKLLSLLDTAST